MPIRNGRVVDWKHKIKGLRNLIKDAPDTEQGAVDLGKDIYNLLTLKKYHKLFKTFEWAWYDLDVFLEVKTQKELNGLLSDVYDYCDRELIWIEL